MNSISKIKGLKYPDEYFTKFFFKNKLHEKKGLKYLEFGCGNGSNLMLPYSYENSIIGVDYSADLIDMANYNFALLNKRDSNYELITDDMRTFVKKNMDIQSDVLSLPNVINYIPQTDFIEFLQTCKVNKLYSEKAKLFIRFRTPRDFRYGLGNRINNKCYKVDNNITGELGALNCFYTEIEMIDILRQYLNLHDFTVLNIDFENIAVNGDKILNSDIVIWGTIG
jgi:SAM-dependent methyltransferase